MHSKDGPINERFGVQGFTPSSLDVNICLDGPSFRRAEGPTNQCRNAFKRRPVPCHTEPKSIDQNAIAPGPEYESAGHRDQNMKVLAHLHGQNTCVDILVDIINERFGVPPI